MSTVTYYAYDFVTGDPIGSVPFRGVSFGGQVNAAGSFQGTLDLADPRVQKFDYLTSTAPERTFLVVDYNEAIVWGGLVSGRRESVDNGQTSRTIEIDAQETWSYWKQIVQATDYSSPPHSGISGSGATMPTWDAAHLVSHSTPWAWDPMLMAAQVIQDALTIPSANPLGGMIVSLNGYDASDNGTAYLASATNTPRTSYVGASYPFTSLQTVDTIVNQFAQLGLNVGFDYGVDVAYSGGQGSTPVATINLSYPRRGRTVAQNNLVFDMARARAYEFPEDGTSTGSTIYETGGNQDIVVDQNIYATEAGYPFSTKVINRSGLNSSNVTALLQSMAHGDLVLFSWPPVAPSVTLDLFDPECGLGTFITGDDIEIVMPVLDQDQQVFDPRFPAGMRTEWRISAWLATVGDQGDSTVQLTLDTPPAVTRSASAL